ncbi:MAG: SUMF1/EgtB/PvdO family nonheme iron enzyme, partial [Rhodobacteraceae bacterium]|nr:SUMF1/EgtB/PvdO family nonheme iron enzyme [Paracoccaceae bacterium]
QHGNYEGAPVDGSVWDEGETGGGRVFRGGSWRGGARSCRSACRDWDPPGYRDGLLGFRCARVQE